MGPTKAQLEQQNAELREALEGVYDVIGEALGIEDDQDGDDQDGDEE